MKKKWKKFFLEKKEKKFILGKYVQVWCMLFLMLSVFACKDDNAEVSGNYDPGLPVTVTNILPVTGGIMTPVVIEGSNFGTDKTKVQVFFNDHPAVVINITNNYIYALVPKCEGGDNEIKVVVDGKNNGVLQNLKFDYIVSAKVTSIASDFTHEFENTTMLTLDVDDEENIVINLGYKQKLYSVRDNKLVTILDMGMYFSNGCFSRDFQYYYALAYDPAAALVVGLNKKNNWDREMIFAPEEVTDVLYYTTAITEDDEGNLFIYGPSKETGGVVVKVHTATREVKLLGTLSISTGEYMAFNPKDKYIYMSIPESSQIIRFDSRAESLAQNDWEIVVEDQGGYADGILSEAGFSNPMGLDFDDDNNLYVVDGTPSHTIRKINFNTGEVSTIGGKNQSTGYVDGEIATSKFYYPIDLCATPDGFVYVMEYFYSRWEFMDSVHQLRCIAIQ